MPSHHLNFVLVLGGQPSLVICKLLVVRQKSTRRNSLGIWDVLVAPRVLEVEYFYAMVRHEAFHDVKVVVPRLLLLLLLVLLMLLLLLMLPLELLLRNSCVSLRLFRLSWPAGKYCQVSRSYPQSSLFAVLVVRASHRRLSERSPGSKGCPNDAQAQH